MDDPIRTRCLDRLAWLRAAAAMVLLLALSVPNSASAAPQLAISPLGYRIEQIEEVPGARRTYDLTARAGVTNSGDAALDVTGQLTSQGASGVVVLDGQVSFGNVGRTPMWQPVISRDTFRLRFVLPKSFSLAGLMQYFQTALRSMSWTLACGNCGENRPPIAQAGPDQTVYVGQLVTLDGSASSDADGQSLEFGWTAVSLPAGSSVELSDRTAVRPTFTPDRDGSYVFELIVNDGLANSAPSTVTVTTQNSAPLSQAGADQTVPVGTRVHLDGSASTDVDGDVLTYEWTLLSRPEASGATLLDADPASPLAQFIVDQPGEYLAQLVVRDGQSPSLPDTLAISTINSAPVAQAGPDQTAPVGVEVDLDGSGSSDIDGDALAYRWSLTVPAGSQATLSAFDGPATSFAIDKPGVYVAQLIVNDGVADSAPDTATISTVNSAPVAHAGADQTVSPGETVTLDGSGSSDVDGDPLGYSWSLTSIPPGSVTALSDSHAVHPHMTLDSAGTYVAQLIVSDGIVNSAAATVTLTARDIPPPPDVEAPVAADAHLISLALEDQDRVRVNGQPGSVEGGAQVIVSNFSTGQSVTVTAAADGSFTASIPASEQDAMLVTLEDAAGNASSAVSVGAVRPIDLTIVTPRENQLLPGSTVLVSGELRAPANTGVTINGKPAAVRFSPAVSTFEAQIELIPPEGAGELGSPVVIELNAHTADGRRVHRSMTVQVRSFDRYTLEASPTDGPAPLKVEFRLADNYGGGMRRLELDFDGDGVTDLAPPDPSEPIWWTYTAHGGYWPTATITDSSGLIHHASIPIHVYEPAAFAASVQAVWNDMNEALRLGNLTTATARLSESARRHYGAAFKALLADMPGIVGSFSPPHATEIGSEVSEFVVTRELNGILRAFFVYLARGRDGVWRVVGM